MSIKSDRWIRRMAEQHGMIEPFEPRQVKIGTRGQWSTELRIDPQDGRLFYQVESIRDDSRPIRWINAGNGATLKAFDAVAHGEGTGVKGDTKTVDSTLNASTGVFDLLSADGRQKTYSANNTTKSVALMTDGRFSGATRLELRAALRLYPRVR